MLERNEVVLRFGVIHPCRVRRTLLYLEHSQRWEYRAELSHQALHIEVFAQYEQDGVVSCDAAQNLWNGSAVDRYRYGAGVAGLCGYHAKISRKGDICNII